MLRNLIELGEQNKQERKKRYKPPVMKKAGAQSLSCKQAFSSILMSHFLIYSFIHSIDYHVRVQMSGPELSSAEQSSFPETFNS